MSTATPAMTSLTETSTPTLRTAKVLVAVLAPIPGNIDGTNVYEIHDGLNFARVRLEKDQNIDTLVAILQDLKELLCFGRHDISRIHLFTAISETGEECNFAATFSQVYKIAILSDLNCYYDSMEKCANSPVSMGRSFRALRVLSRHDFVQVKHEKETLEDLVTNTVSEWGW